VRSRGKYLKSLKKCLSCTRKFRVFYAKNNGKNECKSLQVLVQTIKLILLDSMSLPIFELTTSNFGEFQ
jgi:hypothetical protein